MLIITGASLLVPFFIILLFMIKNPHKKRYLLLLLGIFVVKLGLTYFNMPSRNLLSIIEMNLMWGIIALFICCFFDVNHPILQQRHFKLSSGLLLCCLVLTGIGAFRTYFDVVPTYRSIDKAEATYKEAPTFEKGKTPIAISPQTVENRAKKAISDVPNSQYYRLGDADDIEAQFYKGKPVYIIPLEYQGFLAYFNSKGKLPGYFMIDATDEAATPQFISCSMKYSNTAFFDRNAERQIYRHFPEYITSSSNPQLQIDDKGTPYWVETLYKPEFLSNRDNYKHLKIALLNAQTGETKLYTPETLPKFVNEGITADVAQKMNEVYGKDKYGIIRQFLNKAGMIKPTNNGPENGVTSVFNSDGTISYFVDFTNWNSDNDSGVGYSMIDARTGKLTYYKVSGMMDSDGAKENADQNYKAQKWHAAMPIIYKISNRPVWVMQILDNTNAVRGYYYLDAANQSIHASGSTVNEALDKFNQALADNGVSAGNTPNVKVKEVKGKLDRVALVANNHKLLFTLSESKVIYSLNLQEFQSAALARSGDKVSFKANVVDGKAIGYVSAFKDENLE